MNSDELQTTKMNCIKCDKVYISKVISAVCPECQKKLPS